MNSQLFCFDMPHIKNKTIQKSTMAISDDILLVGEGYKPCPFGLGLIKFELDPIVDFFFKNAKMNASVGLILSL